MSFFWFVSDDFTDDGNLLAENVLIYHWSLSDFYNAINCRITRQGNIIALKNQLKSIKLGP